MEGRAGGATTLPRNKGATLPGYRVGSVRYGVRLAPHGGPGASHSGHGAPHSGPGEPSSARRCSEGDLGVAKRGCAETVGKLARDVSGNNTLQPLVDNGPAELGGGRPAATSQHDPPGAGPSPHHMREAQSLLNNRWAPLTVPSATSLLPPTALRPHALRRSFNSSPRPWVAPSGQFGQASVTEDADNRDSDNNSDKSRSVGGRWRVTSTDGVSVHTKTNSDTAPLKLSTNPPPPPPPEAGGLSSAWSGARPATPVNTPADVATFKSEATILVTHGDKDPAERVGGQGGRSPMCRGSGVGALSFARSAPDDGEGVNGSQVVTGAAVEGAAVLEEVRVSGLPPPAAKYTCCVAGRSPRHLVPQHATMFSCPGPARPAIPKEPASTHLTSDQCSAPPPITSSHAHGSAVQCTVFPSGGSGSVASGGSGHRDRVAPPAAVTPQDGFPSSTPARRPVRPRPEIPDHLYRRWASLLPSDADLDYRKQRQEPEVGAGASGVAPGPSDEGHRPVTSPDHSPAAGRIQGSQDNQLEHQLDLSSHKSARFRLGIPTGGLGGGRKEGGRGPPPARPPRSRQNHLEELRKCTERLKTPSPDKKVRADSAPPPDTTVSVALGEGDGVPPRGKAKKRSSESPRSVLTRHPSLGKSPSLPPQLPSTKDVEVPRLSMTSISKDQREAIPQDARREDEDVFNEGAAKLPPRPRPESRLVFPPRLIPFRSASVSQVDVTSDSSFFSRTGKSPTAIRLYPFCKDYLGSNTLPKRKPAVATKEGGAAAGGPNHHHHHHHHNPPLTNAASISDMTNVGAKSGLSQPEKLENKSKSESELSMAGLSGGDGGLADLRDNLLGKKVEAIDTLRTLGSEAKEAGGAEGEAKDTKGREGIVKVINAKEGDKEAQHPPGAGENCQTKDGSGWKEAAKDDTKDKKNGEPMNEKEKADKSHTVLKNETKDNAERKGEGKEKEATKSNRVSFSDEVKNISFDLDENFGLRQDDMARVPVCIEGSTTKELATNSRSHTDGGNVESESQRRSCVVSKCERSEPHKVVFTLDDEGESNVYHPAVTPEHHDGGRKERSACMGDDLSRSELSREDVPGLEGGAAGDSAAGGPTPTTAEGCDDPGDTRAHVVGELHDTERNYVENLNFLLTRYQQTLKSPEYSAIIDANLVDDIFFQVPEIHSHHEHFLEELKQRIESRDASICVGDIFLQMVKDPSVVESYIAFTNNWKTAQEATKAAAQAKPTFKHFVVAWAREHPGKLDLKALLIKPVQRFPQYELLLKRLLKHTSREHRDHPLLTEAIGVVQQIASRINAVEQEALQHEQQQLLLKELENIIEGLVGLVQPDRTFLRHDMVTMHPGLVTRKERCLFLFSDLLVITAIKRRSGTIRKGSSLPLTLLSSLESNKFKLFKFIPLDDLDIARSRDESVKKLVREMETLQEDLQTLQDISKLTKTLHCPRGTMEETVQDMIAQVQKQLAERHGADSQLMELELTITTQEGMENLTFMFSSAEKRATWEETFSEAKHKLAMSADRRPPPEFVSALPIRKTRAGLQFTCAAATLGLNAHNLKDVWVCNRQESSSSGKSFTYPKNTSQPKIEPCGTPLVTTAHFEDAPLTCILCYLPLGDGYVGQVCVLSLQPDPTVACCNGVCNARILSIASIPAAPQPDSSDDDEDEEIPIDEDIRKRRSESLPPEMGCDDSDNQQPTMWLGTEDGFIHVYNCSDTIRIKKNKFKFQPGSPVHCIIHLDNRVFASLANGDIIIYRRDLCGGWNVADRQVVSISTAAAPVTKMMAVAGKLWCAAMNTVRALSTVSLQVEHSFVVGGENGRGVSCMVSAGHGVWISVHNSASVRLYHAATYECLCEVNVAPAVTKMLAGCDDIIRQHKAACLRVTSLLACKDLLWVGTSAGVIITVPLPHLAHNTHHVQAPLNMVGIPYGHTGHVRFLTSVELTPEPRTSHLKGHTRYSFKGKDHPHHQPGTAAPAKLLVISGGDGYEDFRNSGMSELAGRDDSTNHLLLWQV
ncbi:uncharacterized protein [Panulirus ornatus]|uniref:uncharacterized protein isoform X3 n=1 Tax=Panulirus ornatus TaxID=150431 RepID=UPI003A854E26